MPLHSGMVRDVPVIAGIGEPEQLSAELSEYIDVLMGRVEPPVDNGMMTLMEVADAYYSRACEMEFAIRHAERNGDVLRGSPYYRFRTGELSVFQELAKRAIELGSRRITAARLAHDMRLEK